ncbi:MAG: CAAX prenyl protease-related protein [Nitrospiria bacterium]
MKSRILPFASYMAFIAIPSLFFSDTGPEAGGTPLWLYPIQITLVAAVLIFYWKDYAELKNKLFANTGEAVLSVGVGIAVYFLWVRMDFPWAMQGEAGAGYDPFQDGGGIGLFYAGMRLVGAAFIVPVMEEVFWRSFIIRYIISPDFLKVRLGQFTWVSFLITVVLFGVEHNLWLAGMMAGIAYNLLLYKTRRLWPCIVAHGVTNFILGVHVLVTGEWFWW